MNIKSIKQILLAGMVSCGMAAGLTACSEWNDHYEGAADGGAVGGTLWQELKANPQLSDFCEVLEQTKVYRMHKKTPVSYADLLSGGQSFTVMAPQNGTFNKDSLLRLVQTVAGDSSVEKSFVQNHIARSLVSSTPNATKMLMLNLKYQNMENGKVDGVSITSPNTKASNGVLHVLERALPYKHNLFELLCDHPQLSVIGENLRRFNEDVFDPDASVSNGVVDGVPVYVDSVVYERNRLLNAIGYLKDEDSTYLVVVPTSEGWKEAYDEASQYFQYDETIDKRDSLQQFNTMRALLEDAVFNMTDQKSINDSLISVPYINTLQSYAKGKKVYHVFQKPFEPGGILDGAQPLACSNGTIYTTPKLSLKPTDTYFKDIFVEGEDTYLLYDYDKCSYNIRTVTGDSVSNNKYLRINYVNATQNWTVNFQVNNTLSGSYDIFVILLPKSVYDQENPDLRPCKFKASLSYLDEKGKAAEYTCLNKEGKNEFVSDPLRVDTILLAKDFKFPACNYGQSNMNYSIKIQSSITARQTAQYAREMFLDCIYLRPHNSKSEEQ
jgi:uncharacterized surface protein with fasciclin (FAS1) repeats